MKTLLIILLIIIFSDVYSQLTLKQIDKKLDSLQTAKLNAEQRIQAYQNQLKQINKEIEELQVKKKLLLQTITEDYINAKTGSGGSVLRDKPSAISNVVANIPPNTPIKVYKEFDNLYFKAEYNGLIGYVNYSTLEQNQEIDDYLNGINKPKHNVNNQSNTTIIRQVNENDPRFQKLQKLYGKDVAIRIINSEIWEGMSIGQTIESIGKPLNKTSINTDEGIKEVWEYQKYTLEFLNGSLSKIIYK